MSTENAMNYFKTPDNSNDPLAKNYYGNPDNSNGTDYTKITLDDLGFTVDAVKTQLTGMLDELTDPITGDPYPDSYYESFMEQAVSQAEKEFDIVIRPRLNYDKLDFYRGDFDSFMYVRTYERPILHVKQVKMYLNDQTILDYPDRWIKVTNRLGQIELQPSLLAGGFNASMQVPYLSISGYPFGVPPVSQNEFSPQMLGVEYIAGMIPQPEDQKGINRDYYPPKELIAFCAKNAAIEVLEKWGRTVIGAGIAGFDVSIDGISTSIDSTSSAENTAVTADIILMQNDMKPMREQLLNYYGGRNIGFIA